MREKTAAASALDLSGSNAFWTKLMASALTPGIFEVAINASK